MKKPLHILIVEDEHGLRVISTRRTKVHLLRNCVMPPTKVDSTIYRESQLHAYLRNLGVEIPQAPVNPHFSGEEAQNPESQMRLAGQLLRIFRLMEDGNWRTVDDIGQRVNAHPNSVSAQLRNLRKPAFGSQNVERRRNAQLKTEYRLVVNQATREQLMLGLGA